MKVTSKLNLLVATTTYPRWNGDNTPPFVAQFSEQVASEETNIHVLAPHSAGALRQEQKKYLSIKRFRYFYPARAQVLAYDGGAISKIKKNPVYLLKLLFFLISFLYNILFISLTRKIRIINAHWTIPTGFLAILVKFITRKKVIITVHGGDVFSLNNPVLLRIKRFTFHYADKVVVNSSATLKACKNIYPHKDYIVIPMGIDTDHFKPGVAKPEFINNYQIQGFTILFTGRLSKEKGVYYLLKALSAIKSEKIEFTAIIVGDGPEAASLKSYTIEHQLEDYVIFTGWIDNARLLEFYHAADVFVGPSIKADNGWEEALGMVFIEALATGLPVITTNTGGIADVVEDGKTGYLVEQRSSEAIAEKLLLLYKDRKLLQALSENGRREVIAKFSWITVKNNYQDLFSSF